MIDNVKDGATDSVNNNNTPSTAVGSGRGGAAARSTGRTGATNKRGGGATGGLGAAGVPVPLTYAAAKESTGPYRAAVAAWHAAVAGVGEGSGHGWNFTDRAAHEAFAL